MTTALSFDCDGAQLYPAALSGPEVVRLRIFADGVLDGHSGTRLFAGPELQTVLSPAGSIGKIAAKALADQTRPVRAVMFDKSEATNWAVYWHQDRTIAVKARIDVPGFGPWTTKAGAAHVEPPFEIVARMVTVRAHLDDCDDENAPLLIAPGSHRIGRVPEAQIRETVARLGQATCLAAAGDAWLYATSILHASGRARRPHRRRVLHVDFAADDLPAGLEWLGLGA